MKAQIPEDEARRLAALEEYDILGTLPEAAYDDITRLASEICGTPIAAVSLIDSDRQWFKSKVGLEASETSRDVAFCAHAILEPDLMVVPDARTDARFADNPLVVGDPSIRFYAGAPLITPKGDRLGTLCVIDRVKRELSEDQSQSLRALSRQVMAQLELRRLVAEQNQHRTQLEEANRQLQTASVTDDVSGFHNTRFLHQFLERYLGRVTSSTDKLSLVFFDMDGFKRVVDTHGHLLGARVLKQVAEVVNGQLDLEDHIVRYGGDEYVVILPNQVPEQALAKTERIRTAIEAARFLAEENLAVRVTASFGLATYPDDATTGEQLLAAADKGLFRSKADGKNRVHQAARNLRSRPTASDPASKPRADSSRPY